jgi:hypothetical protein
MKGGVVQITPDALKDDSHWLILEKKSATKVRRAQRTGKGCRIQLSPMEMESSGEGLKEFWEGLKNAGKWVKEKIIDTPFYQQNVKPLVRQAVDAGVALAAPRLGPASDIAKKGVYAIGEKTGAYGLREDFQRIGRKAGEFYQTHAKKYVAPHLRKAVQDAEKMLVQSFIGGNQIKLLQFFAALHT